MTADLHCHTSCSDGSMDPEKLVLLAARCGVQSIAVTDHDTMKGVERAAACGIAHGVCVIPGIELSANDEATGRRVHLLGYFARQTPSLLALCEQIGESRRKAGEIMLERLTRRYPVPPELVLAHAKNSESLYKQHIMHALFECGYTNEFYGPLYRELFDSKNGKILSRVEYPGVQEALACLREAGAAIVLAHPGEYDSYDLLDRLASAGEIHGVEAFHPRNKPEDEKRLSETAERFGLLKTGGTDFHGIYTQKPRPLGTCHTEADQLNRLFEISNKGDDTNGIHL